MQRNIPNRSRNIVFYNLEEAFEASINNERVWAKDRIRKDSKWGKVFLVMTPMRFSEKMRDPNEDHGWYEIISDKERCRLHLDIKLGMLQETEPLGVDMKRRLEFIGFSAIECDEIVEHYVDVAKTKFDDSQSRLLYLFIQQYITKFLVKQFPDGVGDVMYLNGCREDKFSLHVISKDIVFDRN